LGVVVRAIIRQKLLVAKITRQERDRALEERIAASIAAIDIDTCVAILKRVNLDPLEVLITNNKFYNRQ
jgi:hypothetical protein